MLERGYSCLGPRRPLPRDRLAFEVVAARVQRLFSALGINDALGPRLQTDAAPAAVGHARRGVPHRRGVLDAVLAQLAGELLGREALVLADAVLVRPLEVRRPDLGARDARLGREHAALGEERA